MFQTSLQQHGGGSFSSEPTDSGGATTVPSSAVGAGSPITNTVNGGEGAVLTGGEEQQQQQQQQQQHQQEMNFTGGKSAMPMMPVGLSLQPRFLLDPTQQQFENPSSSTTVNVATTSSTGATSSNLIHSGGFLQPLQPYPSGAFMGFPMFTGLAASPIATSNSLMMMPNAAPSSIPSAVATTTSNNNNTPLPLLNASKIEPFPERLHRLLMEVESTGHTDVISWSNDGKSFVIRRPDRFFREIVPNYFKQSRLSSFKRQLNLYGFELDAPSNGSGGGGSDAEHRKSSVALTGSNSGGCYSHELFRRDQPALCRKMRRQNSKTCSKS